MAIKRILFVCKHNVLRSEIEVLDQFGIKLMGKPVKLNEKLLSLQDIVIVVADDVSKQIIIDKKYNKELIVWKISDMCEDNDKEAIREIILKIMKKVGEFAKELK